MYCQDVGSYIWQCTKKSCGILVCVALAQGDHGCIDAAPDELTNHVEVNATSFVCPQCYREALSPLPVCQDLLSYRIHRLIVNDDSTRYADMR
jgi:hypothetical protein